MSARIKWLAVLYLPVFTLIILAAIAALYKQIPVGTLTRDMAAIAQVHPFTGVISNIGILLWNSTATVSIFCGTLLFLRKSNHAGAFLLWSGLFSLVLLFDDFFLFHELIAKRYLGLSEKTVFILYGCIITVLLLHYRQLIIQTNYPLLAVALIFFGGSIFVDILQDSLSIEWPVLLEDGLKFLGISSWFGYYIWTSYHLLIHSPVFQNKEKRP